MSSFTFKMSESGSFTITRPDVIPLHTWTSSFNGDIKTWDVSRVKNMYGTSISVQNRHGNIKQYKEYVWKCKDT